MNKYTKLQPIDDKVVILPLKKEAKTSGGLFLPEESQDSAKTGIVVAVGPGLKEMTSETESVKLLTEIETIEEHIKLKRIGMAVSVGDKILYSNVHGQRFDFNDESLIIQREGEILCILTKK